jgi:hypothetical protein
MHEEKHVLFDEEDHSDSFNDSDKDMEELVNDEQENCFCTLTQVYWKI